jgi:hypothetical protein
MTTVVHIILTVNWVISLKLSLSDISGNLCQIVQYSVLFNVYGGVCLAISDSVSLALLFACLPPLLVINQASKEGDTRNNLKSNQVVIFT